MQHSTGIWHTLLSETGVWIQVRETNNLLKAGESKKVQQKHWTVTTGWNTWPEGGESSDEAGLMGAKTPDLGA